MYSHAVIDQIRYYVPRMQIPLKARLEIAFTVATLTIATTYLLTLAIGFPVLFTLTLQRLPWVSFLLLVLWLVRGRFLRRNPEVLQEIFQYLLVMVRQLSVVVLYPLFFSVFSDLSSSAQTKSVLLLPLIKLVEKNLISRVMGDKDDTKSELVIFNAEVFNALFISCCMQSATSFDTNLAIMVMDFLQACLSLHDLNKLLADVDALTDKMHLKRSNAIKSALSAWTSGGTANEYVKAIVPTFSAPFASSIGLRSVHQVAPVPSDLAVSHRVGHQQHQELDPTQPNGSSTTANSLSASENRELQSKALRILFLTEFVLLVEFTEIMIPVVYGASLTLSKVLIVDFFLTLTGCCFACIAAIYVYVLFRLLNRVYYPQLRSMNAQDLHKAITNVLMYAALGLFSFVLLCIVLIRKLHISAVCQLAFVLEKQWRMVQSKLMMWVVFMLQFTLQHLGADYTFKFKWLKLEA